MPQTDLYYASSPYHHLLSLSLAANSTKNTNSYLISSPNFTNSSSFMQSLRDWDDSPIDYVCEIKKGLQLSQPWYSLFQFMQVLKMRRRFRSLSPRRIYTAKDTEPASQALLHYFPESNKIGIEDGAAAYNSNRSSPVAKWKFYARKLFYGYWYHRPAVLGGSSFIDEFAATFPQHLRPELNRLPKKKISPDFLRKADLDWLTPFLDSSGFVPKKHSRIDTLVLATHSSVGKSNAKYRQRLTAEIESRSYSNATVGVKYHPRDRKSGYLDLNGHDVVEIPSSVPAELIYVLTTDLTTVIGSMSTALLSARWLDEDLSVISMAETTGIGGERLIKTMRSIGIEIR